jgi:hypothetical protein
MRSEVEESDPYPSGFYQPVRPCDGCDRLELENRELAADGAIVRRYLDESRRAESSAKRDACFWELRAKSYERRLKAYDLGVRVLDLLESVRDAIFGKPNGPRR